uniref:Sigma factor n=1 Tax=Erodium texanum TaxID=28960 RepID=A0A0G2SY99_EROTE|nr:sigma factor [Erodium texanum]
MGVVSVSSSAARSPLGTSIKFSTERFKRPSVVAFKEDKPNKITLVGAHEKISLPIDTPKKQQKRRTKASKRVKAVCVEEASPCTLELDYDEAAAKLENLFKLSPTSDSSEDEATDNVVRNRVRKSRRLNLEKRIALRRNKDEKVDDSLIQRKKEPKMNENEKKNKLVREHSACTNLGKVDWKRMKMPPVLPSSDQAWLFGLMQPMKALLKVQEDLQKKLGRSPTNPELANMINMSANEVRKQLDVGRAARNKLIMHNLRLVLFVIKKHFHNSVTSRNFEDLCQAGVQGLITSVDRFEPNKGFRLSTYGLFWIRSAMMKSLKLNSEVPTTYGLQSLKVSVQKAKEDLWFKLHRSPTDEEVIEKVGITPKRYRDVLRVSTPVHSLHAKNLITQEEYINELIDDDEGDDPKRPALLRLALDDVIDSLKPKESLVIRQRFGLDGKGNRTLGEIAGNLNISREMVRKHEMKAMMKLKHPTRVEYIRRHI